jgi:hypothetical protein
MDIPHIMNGSDKDTRQSSLYTHTGCLKKWWTYQLYVLHANKPVHGGGGGRMSKCNVGVRVHTV